MKYTKYFRTMPKFDKPFSDSKIFVNFLGLSFDLCAVAVIFTSTSMSTLQTFMGSCWSFETLSGLIPAWWDKEFVKFDVSNSNSSNLTLSVLMGVSIYVLVPVCTRLVVSPISRFLYYLSTLSMVITIFPILTFMYFLSFNCVFSLFHRQIIVFFDLLRFDATK